MFGKTSPPPVRAPGIHTAGEEVTAVVKACEPGMILLTGGRGTPHSLLTYGLRQLEREHHCTQKLYE